MQDAAKTKEQLIAELRELRKRVAELNVVGQRRVRTSATDITERAKQTREIEHLNRLYSVLSRVSQAVVRATSPKKFLEQVCQEVVQGGGFLLAWIGKVELMTNAVVPTAFWGGIGEYVQGITVYADNRPEGLGPAGTCIREHRPVVHNDFLHDPQTLPWHDRAAPFGIASAAAFPIERARGVWGALTIYSDEVDRFGGEDVKLLEKVAEDIEFALDNLDREFRRKQAEGALLESEYKFKSFAEQAITGINIIQEGVFKYVNPRFAQMFGYTVEECLNDMHFKNLVYAEDLAKVEEQIRRRTSGETESVHYTFRGLKKSGQIFLVEIYGSAIVYQGKPAVTGTILDITERKRAEEALRKSEEKYRQIVETANEGICMTDADNLVTYVNQKMADMLRYLPEEIVGKPLTRFFFPEDLADHREKWSHRIQGMDETYERRFRRSDGGECWTNISVTVIRSEDARFMGAFGMLTDITERKNAEKALHQSELRLRTILQTVNEGFWLIDNATVTMDLNPRMCAILGRNREEVLGRKIFDFVDSENKAVFAQQIGLRAQGEVGTYEIALSRPDGSNVFCLFNATPLFDGSGNKVGSFAMVTDISERKQAEDALRESEEKYRSLFESSRDAIMTLAPPSWRFTTGNPATIEMFGTRSEAAFTTLGPWELSPEFQPDGRPSSEKAAEMIQTAMANESHFFEWTHRRMAGESFPATVLLTRMEIGGKTLLQATVRDITEQKRAGEELRRLDERLQRAEKMEALGTLAGGVAHDLNNVLGIVVGYSELLANDSGESSSARSKAREILKGGLRAAAIVKDLLTLARRGVTNRKVLNFNKIVLECRNSPEFAGISSYHPNVRLEIDLEANLLNISGSAVHLSKSLMNLVSNAAEAMPEGGLITIKTGNQYLDKPVSGYDEVREGDYVVLSVSDTGEGIPAGDLKRIFEPFYTKKVMGRSGTGLGLAVIWGTVKDHLGYINVESQEGKGTIFTLYFPVTREEISQEQVSISAAEYLGNGESILIVDDVKEQRELAGTILKMLNYTVVSVASGEEAVEYLKQNAVDLVVLDMIMDPGMDGLDTYAKILETHPHQRAIIVSGFSETERVSRSQALGAGTYVKKPYVMEKLGLAVRNELDRPA